MVRGVVPLEKMVTIDSVDNESLWIERVEDFINNDFHHSMLNSVSWDRMSGFLHLIEHAIRIFGLKISIHVNRLFKIILELLQFSHEIREKSIINGELNLSGNDEDIVHDIVEDEDGDQKFSDQSSTRVRSLCLLRISGLIITILYIYIYIHIYHNNTIDMINQFYATFDFEKEINPFFASMKSLIELVPQSLSGSSKSPAILKIFHSLCQHENTVNVVASRSEIVQIIILCEGSQNVELAIVKQVMEILNSLLDLDSGSCLLSHSDVIIFFILNIMYFYVLVTNNLLHSSVCWK